MRLRQGVCPGLKAVLRSVFVEGQLTAAISTDRRSRLGKFLSWALVLQGLASSIVELSLGREIGSSMFFSLFKDTGVGLDHPGHILNVENARV